MSKEYTINEIFHSIQGEGIRAGTANIFVRFSGCNLKCSVADELSGFNCDTEFTSGTKWSIGALISRLRLFNCPNVILTGGEPFLQVDEELVKALHQAGFYLACETNGTREIPARDFIHWVCVSPKSAEHTLKPTRVDELKYVRHALQGLPKPQISAEHYLLSPAVSDNPAETEANIQHCIKLVKANPAWRLSVQMHKFFGVR